MYKKLMKIMEKLGQINYFLPFFFLLNIASLIFIKRPSMVYHSVYGYLPFRIVRFLVLLSYLVYLYLLYLILSKKRKSLENKIVLFFSGLTALLVICVNLLLNFFEIQNYPNYVYTKYRVHLPYLQDLSNMYMLSVFLYVFWFLGGLARIKKKIPTPGLRLPPRWPIIFVTFILFLKAVSGNYQVLLAEIKNFSKVRQLKTSVKYFAYDLVDFSRKMNFIGENTGENSVILLPPQSWEYSDIGNQVLVRFFLYPRVLVSPKKVDNFYEDYKGKNCVLYSILAESDTKPGEFYPNFDLDAEKIILFINGGGVVIHNSREFNSNTPDSLDKFIIGLIKHKKCGI